MPQFGTKLTVSLDIAKTLTDLKVLDGGLRRIMQESMQKVCRDVRDLARSKDFHLYKDRTESLTRAIIYRTSRRSKGNIMEGKIFVDLKKAPHGKFVIQGFKGSSHSPYRIVSGRIKRLSMLEKTQRYKNASDKEKRKMRSAIGPAKRIMAFYTTPFPKHDNGKKLQKGNIAPRDPTAIEKRLGETKWVKTAVVDHPGYKGDDFLKRAYDNAATFEGKTWDAEEYLWRLISDKINAEFGNKR